MSDNTSIQQTSFIRSKLWVNKGISFRIIKEAQPAVISLIIEAEAPLLIQWNPPITFQNRPENIKDLSGVETGIYTSNISTEGDCYAEVAIINPRNCEIYIMKSKAESLFMLNMYAASFAMNIAAESTDQHQANTEF